MEGLIGIKHIQEFPVPVFHLQNGLSIFRHKLRPAGSRSRVYCLGGSVPALSNFKENVGPDFTNIIFTMVGDNNSCREILFDGDFTDSSIRRQPLLLDPE